LNKGASETILLASSCRCKRIIHHGHRRLRHGTTPGGRSSSATSLAAINPWAWGLPILLVFAGLSMSVSNTSANSPLQATVAASRRGRTISLFMLATRGGMSIGSLLTGISVSLFGVRYALLINGLLALATHIMIGRRWTRKALASPSQTT
jgi:predicted MFS family arabinose efflux permease